MTLISLYFCGNIEFGALNKKTNVFSKIIRTMDIVTRTLISIKSICSKYTYEQNQMYFS